MNKIEHIKCIYNKTVKIIRSLKFPIIYLCFAAIFYKWFLTESAHEPFFQEMRDFKQQTVEFINKGDRNTADSGFDLCTKINEINYELGNDIEIMDCEQIYMENKSPFVDKRPEDSTSMLSKALDNIIEFQRLQKAQASNTEVNDAEE